MKTQSYDYALPHVVENLTIPLLLPHPYTICHPTDSGYDTAVVGAAKARSHRHRLLWFSQEEETQVHGENYFPFPTLWRIILNIQIGALDSSIPLEW